MIYENGMLNTSK